MLTCFLSVIKNATPVQPIICGEEKGIGYDADAHSNMLLSNCQTPTSCTPCWMSMKYVYASVSGIVHVYVYGGVMLFIDCNAFYK